jgi:hypothetical protein
MTMSVEQSVEWELAGETEVLGENLPQCHFVHLKSHMTWLGLGTRGAAVGSRRLTAWTMARQTVGLLSSCTLSIAQYCTERGLFPSADKTLGGINGTLLEKMNSVINTKSATFWNMIL